MKRDSVQYSFLVIEDNPGDALLVEEYLHEYIRHPKLTWATSLEKAQQHLIRSDGFDAILLDLTLPDCSGKALIDRVLALVKNTPVIVLTGYGDLGFAAQSIRLGVSDYLLKDDLDGAVLYKTIRYSIAGKKHLLDLQRSERRYSDLFQMSPQPAWCLDMQSQLFLEVNDAAIAHYGYSREVFLTMTFKDLCSDGYEEQVLHMIDESNAACFNGMYAHRKKNGQAIIVELKSRLVYRQGQWVCLMLANDVTLQQEYIKNIEHQNKIFQEVVWMLSHEVRAPLARILGLVQLLQLSGENPELQQNAELLTVIQSSSEELDQMIRLMVKKTEDVQSYFYRKHRKTPSVHGGDIPSEGHK